MRRFLAGLALLALPAPTLAAPPPAALAELARLRHDTSAGRLEALRGILTERGIPFEAQRFEGRDGECLVGVTARTTKG